MEDPPNKLKFHFTVKESDITVITDARRYFEKAKSVLLFNRRIIETVCDLFPPFMKSLKPLDIPEPVVKKLEKRFGNIRILDIMIEAGEIYNVGPMAAVAGALADLMREEMRREGARIATVENGGEISINSDTDILIALVALTAALGSRIGFRYKGGSGVLGIGTSSGTFGHAFSFGNADTVTVFARNAAYADAAATAVANAVKGNDIEKSIGRALELADSLEYVNGTFITRKKLVGKSGKLPELVLISEDFGDKFITEKLGDLSDSGFRFY